MVEVAGVVARSESVETSKGKRGLDGGMAEDREVVVSAQSRKEAREHKRNLPREVRSSKERSLARQGATGRRSREAVRARFA